MAGPGQEQGRGRPQGPGRLGVLFADDLAKARHAVARGRGKAAVRHAWAAGIHAHGRADETTLADVVALLERLARGDGAGAGTAADPAVAAEAERARAYCAACLADLRTGKRPPTLLGRLLQGGSLRAPARERRVEKTCPDCAEAVLEAARVCRFCGHRFDGGDPAAG